MEGFPELGYTTMIESWCLRTRHDVIRTFPSVTLLSIIFAVNFILIRPEIHEKATIAEFDRKEKKTKCGKAVVNRN